MKRILIVLLFVAGAAHAVEPVNKSRLTKVAVEGYDVVAYFTQGKAVRGDSDFTHKWNGATWRFATAAHRDAFAKNPGKYAPQYGGYCAFGVSRGYAVGIDPDAWKIVGGKLYLNYNAEVQRTWLGDVPGYIRKADANWPKLLAE